MKSACFQVRTVLARSTRSIRSVLVQAGRFTCRRRMRNCCRSSEFSATSSDLLLGRPTPVPKYERGIGWFGPADEEVLGRLEASACQLLDEDRRTWHGVRCLFVRRGT